MLFPYTMKTAVSELSALCLLLCRSVCAFGHLNLTVIRCFLFVMLLCEKLNCFSALSSLSQLGSFLRNILDISQAGFHKHI